MTGERAGRGVEGDRMCLGSWAARRLAGNVGAPLLPDQHPQKAQQEQSHTLPSWGSGTQLGAAHPQRPEAWTEGPT